MLHVAFFQLTASLSVAPPSIECNNHVDVHHFMLKECGHHQYTHVQLCHHHAVLAAITPVTMMAMLPNS